MARKAISPIIASVILISITIAIAIAAITFFLSTTTTVQQGVLGEKGLLCQVTPLKAAIYVKDGCGVGIIYTYVPLNQPCSKITIDYIEVQGLLRAEPSPFTRNSNILEPGKQYYIVVINHTYRRTYIFYTTTDFNQLLRDLNYYYLRGMCITAVSIGNRYPGSMILGSKTIYFMWDVLDIKALTP